MLPRRDSKPLDQPALLPMFGGMEKKPRLLDREVVTMGRARGSDFCLDGNEVSALHCIIFRAVDGYRVRDCGSRTGTRVNGQAIKNALLGNGDVLQIGPFSFEVRIPVGLEANAAADPNHIERLKRSRSHLVHLALRMRKKLMTRKPSIKDAFPPPTPIATANLADSTPDDKRAAELKQKIKQYDAKVNQLEESEKELFEEQETLKKQKREFETQTKAHAAELAARKKELEDEFQTRWDALQAELKNIKKSGQHAAPHAIDAALNPPSGVAEAIAGSNLTIQQIKESQNLEARKKELDAMEKKLKARDKELNDDYKEILKERDVLDKQRTQWEQEQVEARKQLDDQKENLSSAEFTLKDQKSQLGTMIDQLRTMQEELRASAIGDTAKFQQEIAQLKQELAEAKSQGAAAGASAAASAELTAARAEIAALQQSLQQAGGLNGEVQNLQKEMLATQAALQKKVQTLGADNETLRAQLNSLESAQASAPPAVAVPDPQVLEQVEHLQAENEQLRKIADELEQRLASGPPPIVANANEAELRDENKVLRRLLEEAERELQQSKLENNPANAEKLAEEVDTLKKQIDDKNALIADLKVEVEGEKIPGGDPEAYEAELHRFRKELENDRNRLNKEIESLRVRNTELDEATREMEMELSRERAEMARERIRLDRMRDEVKADMERLQRELEVRGTLAPVQKLREELLQKNPTNGAPPKGAADRLRTMSKLP